MLKSLISFVSFSEIDVYAVMLSLRKDRVFKLIILIIHVLQSILVNLGLLNRVKFLSTEKPANQEDLPLSPLTILTLWTNSCVSDF